MAPRKKKTPAAVTGEALKKAMRVRYKAAGHIRFQVPDALCETAVADALETVLGRREGIYRVTLYRRAGKLSIRYVEGVITLGEIARALGRLIDALAEQALAAPATETAVAMRTRSPVRSGNWFKNLKPVRWAEDKIERAKAYGKAYSEVVTYKITGKSKLPFDLSEWTISFVNDVVVLYLVKTHWQRITTQWLKAPWANRYHWLTVFYLLFLLTRHRKK